MKIRTLIMLLALSLVGVAANATTTVVCDNGCGGGATPSDSSTILARAAPSAARGNGSVIRPTFTAPKTTAVIGSQSFSYGVPLFSYPGRAGMDVNLGLAYNSFIWTASGFNNRQFTLNADFDEPSVGFRLDYGWLSYSSDGSSAVLTEGSGFKHPIGLVNVSPTLNEYRTTDGTDIRFLDDPNGGLGTKFAQYKSGLRVTYTLINPAGFDLTYRPVLLEDANGNTISISYRNNKSTAINTVTDSLGRPINFIYDGAGLLSCVTTAGNCTTLNNLYLLGGAIAQTYKFTWNTSYLLNFAFTRPTGTLTSGTSVLNVLTGVTRPDGTGVQFNYGDWGIVNEIRELSANGTLRSSRKFNYPLASAGALSDNPGYTQETVFDGVNTGVWTFGVTRDATSHTVLSASVTDPSGLMNTQSFDINGLPTQLVTAGAPCSPTPCTTPHHTTRTTFTNDGRGIPRLTALTNILEDDQTQSSAFGYDLDGNTTDTQMYDNGFGAHGPLLREAVASYSVHGAWATRPGDIQIKDGLGHVAFHRTFNYDEGTPATESPNPPGHDGAFSSTARGNMTSTTVYTDPLSGNLPIVSKYTYDNLGNLLTAQDGCCVFGENRYSSATQFAYADSSLIGPPGKQLTLVSYTYNMGTGLVNSFTDGNNIVTSLVYDFAGRPSTATTPDGVVTTTTYDDNGATPSMTNSSTANQSVQTIYLGAYGPLTTNLAMSTAAGNTLVSTTTVFYDPLGHALSTSNPYAPGETPLFTTYGYDPLGRVATVTPPSVSSAAPQKPYRTDYSLATVTVTDPALKQRKEYADALGRIVQIDEPGLLGGAAAQGSIIVTGTEKSVSSSSGSGATGGTASVTMTPTTQADRSTAVLTQAAKLASGSVTISGFELSAIIDPCADQGGGKSCPKKVFDKGTVSITVNGVTSATTYGQGTLLSDVVSRLVTGFASNATFAVSAQGNVVTVAALTAGVAGNSITLSADSKSTSLIYDFGGPSFTTQPSGATLNNGADAVFTTHYDTGTVKVSFTVNNAVHSESVPYGQNDSGLSLVQALQTAFSSDVAMNALVTPSVQNDMLTLTTLATGSGINYPFSVTSVTSSPYFTAGTTSFTATPSGSTFTPGMNGTLYDSGRIRATLTGFNKNGLTESASFGQGSSAITVANSIAAAFRADPISPVDATVASGTSTITFTARAKGTDANGYGISITEASDNGASFPVPSFPTVTGTLSGGGAATVSLDPTVALSTQYTYDTADNLVRVANGQQTRTYVYDSLDRLTSSTLPETGNQPTTYTYKDFGAVATRINPRVLTGATHLTATYDYDGYQRLHTVTYNDATPGVSYAYGAPSAPNNTGNRLTTVTSAPVAPAIGLSATDAYQYDVAGRVTQCQRTALQYATPSTTLLDLGYSYGDVQNNDQIVSIADNAVPSRSTSYVYDELKRLQSAQTTDLTSAISWKLQMSYDRYGNRRSQVQVGGNLSMPDQGALADPATNRLLGGFGYDANGNMTSDGQHTYTFDAADQLVSVDGGVAGNYSYNAAGMRVLKNGVYEVYAGGLLIAEYLPGAALTSPLTEYVYHGGRLLATIASNAVTYHYPDHLSTRVSADASGAITRSFGHLPFGTTWYESAASKWKFGTYERDSESGLDYARARFDSTFLGRFMSRDPLPGRVGSQQSLNAYTYANNDPVNVADPSGMMGGN